MAQIDVEQKYFYSDRQGNLYYNQALGIYCLVLSSTSRANLLDIRFGVLDYFTEHSVIFSTIASQNNRDDINVPAIMSLCSTQLGGVEGVYIGILNEHSKFDFERDWEAIVTVSDSECIDLIDYINQ